MKDRPSERFFTRMLILREDIERAPLMRALFNERLDEHKARLIEQGADPDSIEVYRAWDGADGFSVSIAHQKLPTPNVVSEWAPDPLAAYRWPGWRGSGEVTRG